jgi:hypothetical protein
VKRLYGFDVGDLTAPYTGVRGDRTALVYVLLFGAVYVYLYQRTYPPGS